jgi:hypothetical protein
MRKSTIYFFVVLLLLSLGLTLVPNAFSQTQDIKIVSYSYYIDNQGILDVVGEIQNVGPNTINSVFLTGSVYSSDGTDQCDSSAQVWVLNLAPQQKAPFYMEFPRPTAGSWYSVAVSNIYLQVVEANPTSSYQYPDLKIASSFTYVDSTSANKGVYWVNGTIQNTGSQTAQNITVVGTFYNSTGTVVAVGYTNFLTPVSLAPSGTVPFQVGAFDVNQTGVSAAYKITSYSLLIQTQEPILQGTAPIITPYPSSGSSPSTGTTTSPSTSTTTSPSSSSSPIDVNSNSASNPAVIYAIVIVVVLIAVAGAIIVLRKSKPHQTVKQAKKARKN